MFSNCIKKTENRSKTQKGCDHQRQKRKIHHVYKFTFLKIKDK
ncbi:hypothetical protein LEP1GSC008_0961 [Leptospira kirschneri serovar Bulgarica str. Nikolaevo]|uniref:Uncharacterized protein n=2 Tax=Leptospira kirschneri TaxID=29507 RepID=A0A0E2B0Q0_9LEPT|nr:hypothetical protein LEP1GSC081_1516 [Leptospira kirschneri str. H1]EMK26250.1 hypothetical protein LEP1GSC008_0961 [Leptospira kirschneri serovar Bulgarica str. Nikolaevo]